MKRYLALLGGVLLATALPWYPESLAAQSLSVSPTFGLMNISSEGARSSTLWHFVDERDYLLGVRFGTETRFGAFELTYQYSPLSLGTRFTELEEAITSDNPGLSNQLFGSTDLDMHVVQITTLRPLVRDQEAGRSLSVVVGGGLISFNPGRIQPSSSALIGEVPSEFSASTDPLVVLGGSLRVPVSSRFQFRADIRDNIHFCDNDDLERGHYLCSNDEILNHVDFTVGAEIPF